MQNILVLGDLHFGSPAEDRLPAELKLFTDFVENNPVDIIILSGDYFDHKLSVAPPESAFLDAINFFSKLLSLCSKKSIKLRCIEGTLSHDREMPRMFDQLVYGKDGVKLVDVDYKFYDTKGTEDINGLHFGFFPEEYPEDSITYYDAEKKDHYDLMIGHGTWDFAGFVGYNQNAIGQSPVFKYAEWKEALTHGLSVFGHIHNRTIYKDEGIIKVIYPGSFTSWNFNNTGDCGFVYVNFDEITKKYHYKFINNEKAPIYKSIKPKDLADMGIDLNTITIETAKQEFKTIKEIVGADYVRIDLSDVPEEKAIVFQQMFDGAEGITADGSKEQQVIVEQVDKNLYHTYEWLLKDTLPMNEAIRKFAKDILNKDIPLADIDMAIKKED
jgi:DNA repair exonuclease SbcCD nuclease subunit